MDNETVGMIAFLGVAFVASLTAHLCIRRFLLASFIAACVTVALCLLVHTPQNGYLRSLFPSIPLVGGFHAMLIAMVVGIPFLFKRKAARRKCENCSQPLVNLTTPQCPHCGERFLWSKLYDLDPPRYPMGHCQSCGYNLTGNTSGRCPECGEHHQDAR